MRSRRVVTLAAPAIVAGALLTAVLALGSGAVRPTAAVAASERAAATSSQVDATIAEVTVDGVVPARPVVGDRETVRTIALWRAVAIVGSAVALLAVVWSRRRRDASALPAENAVRRSWTRFRAPPAGLVPAPPG